MLPEIDLEGFAVRTAVERSELMQAGVKMFLDAGVLLVRNAYDKAYIKRLQEEYGETYRKYLVKETDRDLRDFQDAKGVGHNRIQIPLHLNGSFCEECFYANEGLMPMLEYLLGRSLIINSLGSVFSMPGSPDQHAHRDMENIYVTEANADSDCSWLSHAPPYAVTVGIPLVPITQQTGNTRFWPGTHLTTIHADAPGLGDGVDFTCDIGTCVLFDYRIIHAGVANTSEVIRPLLYCVYSRPWFRDSTNYDKHEALNITAEQFSRIPQRRRPMFSWALDRSTIRKAAQVKPRQLPSRNDPCYCNSGLKYKHCHGKLTE